MRLASPASLVLSFALAACASSPASPAVASPPGAEALAGVTFVHGGAGPWVVAGYRMGEAALARLGLPRQSFDLDVVHHTPPKVQFSCMADGATASTGASLGKLNLKLVDATDENVATTYTNRANGKSLTLRPTAAFVARFRDVPRERLLEAGREVMALPDAAIFEETKAP